MLAELVKAGKLPPVEQRLPEPADLMVVKPLKEIGKYGGRWRRGFTGPADNENGNRIVSTDKILMWDYTGNKVAPSLAKDWRQSDDGKLCTHLPAHGGSGGRMGSPSPRTTSSSGTRTSTRTRSWCRRRPRRCRSTGSPAECTSVTTTPWSSSSPSPYFLFVDILAGDTLIGGGQATQMARSSFMGAYAPAHYLKQFLPKYSSVDEVQRKAKAARLRQLGELLPQSHQLGAQRRFARFGPVEDRQPDQHADLGDGAESVLLGRGHGGESAAVHRPDRHEPGGEPGGAQPARRRRRVRPAGATRRSQQAARVPRESEEGQLHEYTWTRRRAAATRRLLVNTAFDADPEVAKWLTSRDFRRALSLGIDRDQLNEAFWLGIGTPGSTAPAEDVAINPGKEYRKKWAVLDIKQANALLDKLGLTKKDGEGYRLRTDGKGRLRIELMTVGGQFTPVHPGRRDDQAAVEDDRDRCGREGDRAQPRLHQDRPTREHHIMLWTVGGSENLYLFPRHVLPVDPAECHLGMPFARWYATNGAPGQEARRIPRCFAPWICSARRPARRRPSATKIAQEIWKIIVEECWVIGTVGLSPALMGVRIVKNTMGNIPARQTNAQHVRTPNTSHPATFFFKE